MPKLTDLPPMPPLIGDGEPPTGRNCGGCTACCSTVPVRELGLRGHTRCPYLHEPMSTHIGCSIYPSRPASCRSWRCAWLKIGSMPDRLRPDRVGFVISENIDLFRLTDDSTGKVSEHPCAEIWVLPGHEDDWKTGEDAGSAIQNLIDLVGAVLWRMPSGLSIAFMLHDGKLVHTAPRPSSGEEALGGSVQRLLRAGDLLRQRG